MQQHFCNHANAVVVIIECREELLIGTEVPSVVPLQMANKEVQRVAMSDVLRHLSQLDLFPCIRLNGYLNRRHLWPFVSVFGVADDLPGHHADRINR